MALSVREMFLIVRAQDQASRTLASVGRQLGVLGRQSQIADRALQLQARRGQLNLARSAALQKRAIAMAAGDDAAIARSNQQLQLTRTNQARLLTQFAAFEAAARRQPWDRMRAGLHAFSDAGRVAQYGGAILTGTLGAMAYSAANFNTEIVRAATQTGRSFNDIIRNARVLEPAVQSVMRHSASSSQELTSALYEIFSSMDVTRKGGVRLLKLLSDASIGGMAPLEDVTRGVITVMNNFGKSVARAPGFLNRMFAAVRFGRTTFAEFAQTLSTTVPAAHQQNQSFDLMAGTIAFLTRSLGNVSRASVGYARALEILNRQKTVENFKAVGVAIRDAHNRMLPLPQVLQNITRRFPGLISGTKDWQNILSEFAGTQGTIQARRALTELTNDMQGYRSVVRRVSGDNVEFARSVKALKETPGVQFRIFVNQLKSFAFDLGRGAIPAFQKMIAFMQKGLDAFQSLNAATKGNIGNILAWVAVLTTAAGTLAVITGAVGRLALSLRALGTAGLLGSVLFGRQGNIARLGAAGAERAAAIQATETALLAGGGTAALGGVAGRGARGMAAFRQARVESGLLRASLVGAGAAMAGLATSATVTGVAMVAIAVPAGLLYLRMRAAREQAERLAEAQRRFRSTLDVSITQPLGIAQRGPQAFLRARDQLLNLKEVNAQIRIQRREMKGLTGDEKTLAGVNLSRLLISRRQILSDLHRSTVAVRDAEQNFGRALEGTNRAMQGATNRFRQIQKLRAEETRIRATTDLKQDLGAAARVRTIQDHIAALQAEMTGLRGAAARGFEGLDQMVSRAVQALRAVRAIPRVPRGGIADIQQFARQIKRFPRLRELRALIRAEIDPSSLKDAPATVRRFFRTRPVHVPVALDFRSMGGTQRVMAARARAAARQLGAGGATAPTTIHIDANTQEALRKAEAARNRVNNMKTHLSVGANTGPAHQAVGALQSWINRQTAQIQVTASVTKTIEQIKKEYQITSPSKVIQRFLDKHPNILHIHSDVRSILKELSGATKLIHKELKNALIDAAKQGGDALIAKFREIRENISGTFGLQLDQFNQIRLDWGVALNIPDLTKNLRKTNVKLQDYFKDFRKLIRKGVPRSLLLQLAGMGPEGQAIIDAMAGSTPAQRRAFIRAWRRNQQLIQKVSMQQFHVQLHQWRRMGRSMALGIILGLRDEEAGLYRFFRRMFIRMLRSARHAVGAHSPAREYQRLGQDIVRGLERGLNPAGSLRVPMPGIAGGVAMGIGQTPTIHMTVNANRDESLMSTLERTSFRLRHRRG